MWPVCRRDGGQLFFDGEDELFCLQCGCRYYLDRCEARPFAALDGESGRAGLLPGKGTASSSPRDPPTTSTPPPQGPGGGSKGHGPTYPGDDEDEDDDEANQVFGGLLLLLLERDGVTPDQLAAGSGLGRDIVDGLLCGRRPLIKGWIHRLAVFFTFGPGARRFLNHVLPLAKALPVPPRGGLATDVEDSRLSGARLEQACVPYTAFVALLERLRALGVSQTELADRAGLPASTVTHIKKLDRPLPEADAFSMVAGLALNPNGLRLHNDFLVAAGLDPLPVPGEGRYTR